jgi:hypothetical protein
MTNDVLKIVESEIEVIRLDYIEIPLAHSTLDLLVDRIKLRFREELPPLMSPEHAAQESTRCYECSLEPEGRCDKHRVRP